MPNNEISPVIQTGADQLAKADTEFTRLLGLQRHEPLDAETRAEIDLLVKAAEMGFRLATRCTRCNQWLVAPSSVRRHMGAVCAVKSVAADG